MLVMLTIGAGVLWLPEVADLRRLLRYRMALFFAGFKNEDGRSVPDGRKPVEKLTAHLSRLLQAALSMGTMRSVKGFVLLSLAQALLCFVLTVRLAACSIAMLAALAAMVTPYLILQCSLRAKRVAGSHEGEILVTELLNNYKINYCNMQQAIEVTAMHIEDAPNCRRLLLNLSKGLNRAAGNDDVLGLLQDFRFAIGTSWAGILTMNIYLGYVSGIRVTDALSDLARSMMKARQIEEYARRENSEGRLILRYLVPVCALLMLCGVGAFGLPLGTFLHYQFGTGAGITWLTLWLVSYLAAIVAYLLLSKRKFDL